MSENNKTILFVFVAAVVAVVAWAARPRLPGFDEAVDVVNQPLFPDTNLLSATSLEIVQFDEQSGQVKPFKVAQVKDKDGKPAGFGIPSHENYPADAKDHLAEAATSLMDLTVLGLASQNQGDFYTYGVVDPMSKDVKAGAVGVGTRITMRDKDDKVLLALIVGKEIPDRKDIRYVRKVDQDPVYEVALKTDKLSANFGDWIEKDLLKLSTFDIKGVQIFDYSVDAVQGRLLQRGQIAMEYNDSGDPRWKIAEDKVFQERDGKWVPQTMAPDEEVNTQKLDDMKTALGDLKIVDVNRKPTGLSGNLRNAGEVRKDRRSVDSLAQRGFYVARVEGREELLSSEGEVRVVMKDGVAYVLRFGQIAGTSSPSPKKDETKKDDHEKSAGVNRYLFVMAEFNPDVIEKPKLEPLPPEPKPDAKPEAKKDDAKKDAGKKDEGKKDEKKEEKPDPKAERERIEKENKKKEEEYKEKLKKGEDHVKELNARFADWYYVIADDVYQKIHLGRKDLVKKKEKKEEEKKDGEKKADTPAAPANSPAELNELKGALPAPKMEAPKTEAPKAEAPKPEAAKPQAPKAESPKTAAPKAEAPKTPAPATPPAPPPAKAETKTPAPPPAPAKEAPPAAAAPPPAKK